MSLSNMPLPSFDDVLDAAKRLSGRAAVTPLLNAPLLDAELGGTLYVKPEPLQKTGSFQFRGAYNRNLRRVILPEGNRADLETNPLVPAPVCREVVRYAATLDDAVVLAFGDDVWIA